MSRVEDDREEARVAALLAEQRRAEASRRVRTTEEAGAFAARVASQRAQEQGTAQLRVGQGAVAQLLEEAQAEVAQGEVLASAGEARREAEGEGQAEGARARLQQRTVDRGRRDGQRSVEVFAGGEQAQARAGRGRSACAGLEARGRDSLEAGSRLEGRYQERREAQAAGPEAGGARGEAADADAGGGGQGAGGRGGQRPAGAGPTPQFRLNPALMPPVPVAQRRDTGGSDRLRAVANELAQKIVERVRVGTNALGRVEFQVDLRADVLAGLTVKVSANLGRITAVFSGSDRAVLKLIEQHGEALRGALAARGLTLEAFRTEARP